VVASRVRFDRGQNTRRGFHRIGIVLAIVILILGGVATTVVVLEDNVGVDRAVGILLFFVIGAIMVYGAAWALGWIFAGFMGDSGEGFFASRRQKQKLEQLRVILGAILEYLQQESGFGPTVFIRIGARLRRLSRMKSAKYTRQSWHSSRR
jgi:hypothetical protein